MKCKANPQPCSTQRGWPLLLMVTPNPSSCSSTRALSSLMASVAGLFAVADSSVLEGTATPLGEAFPEADGMLVIEPRESEDALSADFGFRSDENWSMIFALEAAAILASSPVLLGVDARGAPPAPG